MSIRLIVDPSGNCETKWARYDFTSELGSDSLSDTAPTLSASVQGVTFGTPVKTGNIWSVLVSIPGGNPGYTYRTFCRATTVNNQTLTEEIDVALIGQGLLNPLPPLDGSVPSPQTPNTIYAGPASGATAPPAFRQLVPTDLPYGMITVTDAPTVTLDLSLGTSFYLALTATGGVDRTVLFANGKNGQDFQLLAQQPASGGPYTITFGASSINWQGGTQPPMSQTAGAIDWFDFKVLQGSQYEGAIIGGGGTVYSIAAPVFTNGGWIATPAAVTTSGGFTLTSPLTTKGDLYVFGTQDGRFPVGPDGTFLGPDSTKPNGLAYKTIPGVVSSPLRLLSRQIGPVGNGADTTFDTLFTYTMPAGTLVDGHAVRIRFVGKQVGGTDTHNVRLYFGGSGGSYLVSGSNTTAADIVMDAEVVRVNSTTVMFYASYARNGIAASLANSSAMTVLNLDANDIAIYVTAQSTLGVANNITGYFMTVWLEAP